MSQPNYLGRPGTAVGYTYEGVREEGQLRAARRGAGLSQGDLELLTGIPKARLSRYENNHVVPSLETFVRLCRALGVPPGELLDTVYSLRR